MTEENEFNYKNDINNCLKIVDENSFFGVQINGTHNYGSMVVYREDMKELYKWFRKRFMSD